MAMPSCVSGPCGGGGVRAIAFVSYNSCNVHYALSGGAVLCTSNLCFY